MNQKNKSVAIIGLGPAGITAALYLIKAGINPIIFEKNSPGGQLNQIINIDNYPGYKDKSGSILSFEMYSQLEELNPNIISDEVLEIIKSNDEYIIKTNKGNYNSKYIIISSGKVPRKLNIAKSEDHIGKGISYCALCDGALYKNKNVLVVGNSKAAVFAAEYLSNIASKVYMISDKSSYGKYEEQINKHSNIEIMYETKINDLIITNDRVSGVELSDNTKLDIDCIFVYLGHTFNNLYYQNLNIETDKFGIVVDKDMKTSQDNIFACGDSISKGLYQVVTACSEGAVAAHSIIKKQE